MIPKIKKFFTDGSCLISIKALIERTQKSNKIISVDIKKDETLTTGIIKKLKAQIRLAKSLWLEVANCYVLDTPKSVANEFFLQQVFLWKTFQGSVATGGFRSPKYPEGC